jgi:hypothetical protein
MAIKVGLSEAATIILATVGSIRCDITLFIEKLEEFRAGFERESTIP